MSPASIISRLAYLCISYCSLQFVHEKEIVAEDDQVFLMKLQVRNYIRSRLSMVKLFLHIFSLKIHQYML